MSTIYPDLVIGVARTNLMAVARSHVSDQKRHIENGGGLNREEIETINGYRSCQGSIGTP